MITSQLNLHALAGEVLPGLAKSLGFSEIEVSLLSPGARADAAPVVPHRAGGDDGITIEYRWRSRDGSRAHAGADVDPRLPRRPSRCCGSWPASGGGRRERPVYEGLQRRWRN